MGGGNSTRRVTIDNDADPSAGAVVEISQDAAERLFAGQRGERAVHGTPQQQAQPLTPVEAIASEIRAEELQRLKDFYEKRIAALESSNKELYQTTTEQFAQAVEEVEKKFLRTTQPAVCQPLEESVLKCYQSHPGRTLNCSAEVKAFASCVQSQRESLLAQKG